MPVPPFPRRSALAKFKVVDGEAMIVYTGDPASTHVLNPVGTRIWELLDGGRQAADLAAQIAAEFEVTPEAAAHDVGEFLEALDAAAMIEDGTGGDHERRSA